MSLELKIKSKHLSEEARIIRFETNKLLKQIKYKEDKQEPVSELVRSFKSLDNHRRFDVRCENRATFLARAYIADKAYSDLEQSRKTDYYFLQKVLPRVIEMVAKYNRPSIRLYDTDYKTRKKTLTENGKKLTNDIEAWLNLN